MKASEIKQDVVNFYDHIGTTSTGMAILFTKGGCDACDRALGYIGSCPKLNVPLIKVPLDSSLGERWSDHFEIEDVPALIVVKGSTGDVLDGGVGDAIVGIMHRLNGGRYD